MAADPVSSNLSLIEMSNGTASGSWGTVLNASMIAIVDQALGNSVNVSVSSSDVNLTTTQRQNLIFNLTGTLSGNINVTLPLSPNSTSAAVGGVFVIDNQSSGPYSITIKTIATGSVGVVVPQGARSTVISNGQDVKFADDTQNQLAVYAGNPNGNVAGNAPSVSTRGSLVINSSTNETYLATTSGTAGSAVWHKNLPYSFPSEAYVTLSSDATNPVLTSDAIGATTVYVTAFRGDQIWVYNGVSFVPVTIPGGQLSIPLSASFQTANDIFDVLGFLSTTGVVRAAFSPAWSTPTAGAGARGTGAGTPQLARLNGILVNAVSQTVNNGSNQFTVAANRGTYLGTVAIDGTAGQITCHVSYGTSRKWGVWNAYNRVPIVLQEGDGTGSWSTSTSSFRASRNSTSNAVVTLCGLPEEAISVEFAQNVLGTDIGYLGIGVNSTSAASGLIPWSSFGSSANTLSNSLRAKYSIPPSIGVQRVTSLERTSGNSYTFYGNSSAMLLGAYWNG